MDGNGWRDEIVVVMRWIEAVDNEKTTGDELLVCTGNFRRRVSWLYVADVG